MWSRNWCHAHVAKQRGHGFIMQPTRALVFVRRKVPDFLAPMEDRQQNGDLSYRFWQRGGGCDQNLTEPTTVWAMVDSIHANPVRRGLCARSTGWVWSSAAEWERTETGLLRVDRESFPRTEAG